MSVGRWEGGEEITSLQLRQQLLHLLSGTSGDKAAGRRTGGLHRAEAKSVEMMLGESVVTQYGGMVVYRMAVLAG